jgi:hypothetical protein
MIHVTQGTGAGLHSIPNLGGGAVWIGGGQRLVCADPVTGQTRASVAIPTVNGVLEYLSNVAVTGGHAYALYVNPAARAGGIARLTPPPACSG